MSHQVGQTWNRKLLKNDAGNKFVVHCQNENRVISRHKIRLIYSIYIMKTYSLELANPRFTRI